MKAILLLTFVLFTYTTYAQTVKKVYLEYFAGGWCQTCPNGAKAVEDMDGTHGNKFIAVAVHNKDGFDIPDGDAVDSAFDVTTYPAAAINRKKYSGKYNLTTNTTGSSWKSKVSSELSNTAIVSVSMDNLVQVNDSTFEGDVVAKFNTAPASGVPIVVNVLLSENKIEAKKYFGTQWGNIDIAQKNATSHYGHNGSGWTYTTTASSGNTFYYHHTLREMLGGSWGWAGVVPANPAIGTTYTKHFTFTVSPTSGFPIPWKQENMEVVAYVAYNGSLSGDELEVLNAERVMLSSFKTTGIAEISGNISISNTYPNPAHLNDVVNIEFQSSESGLVTLNVYNITGKHIAQPYVSNDVKGSHTILWKPSDDNLASGAYILEVNTPSGKSTQMLNIF